MGIVSMREDLASAVSTVAGVKGYAYRPPAPKTGDVWPRLGPMPRDEESQQFEAHWQLVVMLPQVEKAASEWIDSHAWQLVDAIQPHGYVDQMAPAVLPTQAGDQFVLEIQLRGEM